MFKGFPVWGTLGLQEGVSLPMELLNYFHDYMMIFLVGILTFVSYLFIYVSLSPYYDSYTMDSHVLETVWTVIPMFILGFMAFPSLFLLYLMEEISFPELVIKVTGHQWYWEYEYFQNWINVSMESYMSSEFGSFHNLDVDNRLVLPSFSSILFLITSADVLHSWTVPALGIKIDSIPGRLNYLTSTILGNGVFFGQCSEICGSNHSFMPIALEVIPVAEFMDVVLGD